MKGMRLGIGVAAAGALAALLAACGGGGADRGGTTGSPAGLGADTGRFERWAGASPPPPPVSEGPPRAAVSPAAAQPGAGLVAQAEPAAPDTWPAGPGLPVPPGFKPPVLKTRPPLPAFARADSVEVEVLVDARGQVVRVERAGGSADSVKVRAATAYAQGMTFYPALKAGNPVPAWSRQVVRLGVVRP